MCHYKAIFTVEAIGDPDEIIRRVCATHLPNTIMTEALITGYEGVTVHLLNDTAGFTCDS
jgi:hypothetical protein